MDYLKIDYNIKESNKHLKDIYDRIKVLNLEDCMFELKTILDYVDGIFNDFEITLTNINYDCCNKVVSGV